MKRIFLTIAFFAAAILGVFANEITPSFAAPVSDKSFAINLSAFKSDEVEVSIVDQFGVVVISETVATQSNKARVYNMKHMEDGNYTVVLQDITKTSKQEVILNDGEIVVGEQSNTVYKPRFNTSGDVVKINYLALGKDVTVRLTDADGNVLYTEDINNLAVVSKALNVAALDRGFYYASVVTPEATYTYDVIK
ncbi:MAG: T9SS type A sorting domain-containing protein [Saprospiraceae bacterium]|nr:T9SS type A sorting domain-containing protein [Saprospiraceae bacterium]